MSTQASHAPPAAPKLLCQRVKTWTILSNGDITTCCNDGLGLNIFANISDFQSIEHLQEKLLETRRSMAYTPELFEKCNQCLHNASHNGIRNQAIQTSIKINPSEKEATEYFRDTSFLNSFTIEPSSTCTIACIGCPQSLQKETIRRSKRLFDFNTFTSLFKDVGENIQHVRLFNYGEPLLNRQCWDFTRWLRLSKSPKLIICTNGMLLSSRKSREELVDNCSHYPSSIAFSIHGCDQKKASMYMTDNFPFKKVYNNMKKMQQYKKMKGYAYPDIIWKQILFTWNDSDKDILKSKRLAEKADVELRLILTHSPSPSMKYTPGSDKLESSFGFTRNNPFCWSWKK